VVAVGDCSLLLSPVKHSSRSLSFSSSTAHLGASPSLPAGGLAGGEKGWEPPPTLDLLVLRFLVAFMALAHCGTSLLGCSAAVAAVGLLGYLVVVAEVAQVCLNNLPLPRPTDLVSPSPPPPPPPHPRDPLASASPSPPLHADPKSQQPHGRLNKIPPEVRQKISPPPGIRFRAPSIADDGKPTHLSVVWCGLPRQLGRSLFNRRTARSSHPAALAIGDIPALRRRLLHRRFLGGSLAVQVQ
jgi:hypothetical protein